jgi:hypothetical protein
MESLSRSGVLVDIELHKLHLALCSGRGTLEDGCEGLARTTPRSPEINNHWNSMRTLYNLSLEGGIGDI